MGAFKETISKETQQAADKFIKRIKGGIITKRHLSNTGEVFNADKASESFDKLITSETFDRMMRNAYKK